MADVQQLRRGNIYEEDSQLWRVLDFQHIKMARGGATIRLKVRNLRSGATIEKTYNSGARVDDIRLDSRDVEYLYTDGDLYHFMDTETFEQVALSKTPWKRSSDSSKIIPSSNWNLSKVSPSVSTCRQRSIWKLCGQRWLSPEIPPTAPTKEVELETGYRLNVPMFVKEGDTVRIDTRDGRYVHTCAVMARLR